MASTPNMMDETRGKQWCFGSIGRSCAMQSEIARMVEYLQGKHRKLQIRSKTLNGMIKPLTKNFETLMEENQELCDEFAGIHKKNEVMKASNTELVDRRSAAEKKTKELKGELKSVLLKFMPVVE
jgi:chromosome segregation ATPase